MFGNFIRKYREEKGLGLREFCLELGIDPSLWSKVERGVRNPPRDSELLKLIAKLLDIPVDSAEYTEMNDLAAVDSGRIPKDVMSDQRVLASLPLVFRTLRGDKPTKEELERIAYYISKNVSHDRPKKNSGTISEARNHPGEG